MLASEHPYLAFDTCANMAPLKSGGNCQHDHHVLLGGVPIKFLITSGIKNVGCCMVQPCHHHFP
jgi:hypothetical protein